MQITQTDAERRLAEMKIQNIPVMEIQQKLTPVRTDWYQQYKSLIPEFMRSLSDAISELAMMNLNRDEFMGLLMGRKIPDNLSIRFRVPLIFGGNLDIENLFACLTFPTAHNMDRFIIEQYGNETLWLPNPTKKIYLPIHSTISGNGGNGVQDRLSQFGSTMSGNRRA